MSTINHAVVAFSREETALEDLTLNLCTFQIRIATPAFKSEVVLKIMSGVFFFTYIKMSGSLSSMSQVS